MKISDIDIIYISYDEPNAEINYADLLNKAPWAKRVHGVKGSDAAHKAAAQLSDTDWFVTVDGDNQIDIKFLNLELDTANNSNIKVYSWCGYNVINGLKYGNGGLKVWSKDFVNNMKTHESASSDESQIDFCWQAGYKNFPFVFSNSIMNETPYQAWRAGFREGVKMLTKNGIKVKPQNISAEVYWHNIHRLRVWSSIGAHSKNGLYAILGARQGSIMLHDDNWDYRQVRDFEVLEQIYNDIAKKFENDLDGCQQEIENLSQQIKIKLGLNWANFNPEQSLCLIDFYNESIELGRTYYSRDNLWKNSF
jgi:hypothetical protein